jgi:hypothetical protein
MSGTTSDNIWEVAWRNAEAMTAAGQEPRRHHLLPRFYLQRWAVEDRVRVIDLERDRNAYETAPERAAIETDFYRLLDSKGMSPVYWEAWLSQVEGHAVSAFEVLDTDRPGDLDEEQHQWLALFLAVQMTRGRKARDKRRAMLAEELTQALEAYGPESLIEELRRGDLFAYSDEDSLEAIMADVERFRSDPSQLPLTREQDLEMFAHTATHVAGLLTARHFALYKTPRALITSDEPSSPRFSLSELFGPEQRIVLLGSNKGVLGPESARLLTTLVSGQLWPLILGRAKVPHDNRRTVSIYIDEAQDYMAMSGSELGDALAQSRSLGAAFHLAFQSRQMIPDTMRGAIDQNCRNKILFTQAGKDAADSARLTDELQPRDFQELPAYNVYATTMQGPHPSGWLSAATLPPPEKLTDPSTVRAISAERYGVPADETDTALRQMVDGRTAKRNNPSTDRDADDDGVGRRRRQ